MAAATGRWERAARSKQVAGHCGVDRVAAGGDVLDGVDEPVTGGIFEQITGGARLNGVENPLLVGQGGEHQHPGRRESADDLAGRLNAVDSGHLEVHERHVRLMACDEFDGLGAVDGHAEDFDRGDARKQRSEAFANDLLVVADDD